MVRRMRRMFIDGRWIVVGGDGDRSGVSVNELVNEIVIDGISRCFALYLFTPRSCYRRSLRRAASYISSSRLPARAYRALFLRRAAIYAARHARIYLRASCAPLSGDGQAWWASAAWRRERRQMDK